MTDAELDKINAERRRQGKPPLSRIQASRAMAESGRSNSDGGFDMTGFLIGYTTGIPYPSGGGIVGAMLHSSTPVRAADDAPSYSPPSHDTSPSYSSPSYDSGSSYSGGSDSASGGGGGGD